MNQNVCEPHVSNPSRYWGFAGDSFIVTTQAAVHRTRKNWRGCVQIKLLTKASVKQTQLALAYRPGVFNVELNFLEWVMIAVAL